MRPLGMGLYHIYDAETLPAGLVDIDIINSMIERSDRLKHLSPGGGYNDENTGGECRAECPLILFTLSTGEVCNIYYGHGYLLKFQNAESPDSVSALKELAEHLEELKY